MVPGFGFPVFIGLYYFFQEILLQSKSILIAALVALLAAGFSFVLAYQIAEFRMKIIIISFLTILAILFISANIVLHFRKVQNLNNSPEKLIKGNWVLHEDNNTVDLKIYDSTVTFTFMPIHKERHYRYKINRLELWFIDNEEPVNPNLFPDKTAEPEMKWIINKINNDTLITTWEQGKMIYLRKK